MTNTIRFLIGLLLLCLPLFRQDFFVAHATIFPLYFFLFPIGLIIILWSISGRRFFRLGVWLGVFIFIEVALVGSVVYMAHYQRYTPLTDSYYYWVRGQYGYFKNTTNFDSNLSRYDSSLTYRFRPGITGRFTNPEFDVEIKTNSLGVRDDEASLQQPSIVVLGDSHAMGWGVEHQERFSGVLENRLHVKVLNTAITSYGTHRETKLLDQVDLDSCQLLIIQYCENDLEENKANLIEAQNIGMDNVAFKAAEKQNTINKTYFPFKGIFLALRWLITTGIKSAFQPASQASPSPVVAPQATNFDHAEAFFPYLSRVRERYEGPIIVFDLGVYNYPIVKEFQAYQALHPTDNIHFVNVHPLLTQREYFTIDDHINARGHAKIGKTLADFIQKMGWLKSYEVPISDVVPGR
ncbi:SGNH/GDSL hydrolase family protein [Persicitalea sp.]|uniref:SGNH/GDSL hydrolase family protein n=1 Tax=Persicitalea sp. TaxID=3100273 RepID=UPI003593BF4A